MHYEIIIPFYNEAPRLVDTLKGLADEIAINSIFKPGVKVRFWWADDGSIDGSSEVLKKNFSIISHPQVSNEVLRCEKNRGKGSIMRHAIDHLRTFTNTPERVIGFWDSDGELHPAGLFEAMQVVGTGQADLVFGSRFSKRNAQVLRFRHYLGNKMLTMMSNWFSNLNLSDVHCCARFMKASLLFQLPLKSTGFDFEAEFAGTVGRIRAPNLKLWEIPVVYVPRSVEEGKKIGFMHILPQFLAAIKCRYFREPLRLKFDGPKR